MKRDSKLNPRIVHLTVGRNLSSGQRKQLQYESSDANEIRDVTWTTLALHTEMPEDEYERRIPWLFRAIFIRNLYAWYYAYQLSKEYDIVMLKHITFDPFTFVSLFIPNRISVHHSKEIYELRLIKGVLGRCASFLERIAGGFALRNAKAVVGVTSEIAKYEAERCIPNKNFGVYPNGISLGCVSLAEDDRQEGEMNVVFICGVFVSWHGLDLLIDAVDNMQTSRNDAKLKIHLIGELTKEQAAALIETSTRRDIFVNHGVLDRESYLPILNRCNLGLTSFGLHRKGLAEAATLKVRELLAMGIPVYSGHSDTAIPTGYPFYLVAERPDIGQIRQYCLDMRQVSREEVHNRSMKYISKSQMMKTLIVWMRDEGLLPQPKNSEAES